MSTVRVQLGDTVEVCEGTLVVATLSPERAVCGVFGWGSGEPLTEDCWQEIADQHGWDQDLVGRLQRAHDQFEKLSEGAS